MLQKEAPSSLSHLSLDNVFSVFRYFLIIVLSLYLKSFSEKELYGVYLSKHSLFVS